MLECEESQIKQFFLIQGQIIPNVTVRFDPNHTHPRSHCLLYCDHVWYLNWSTFVLIRSIIELIQDLMVTYILTKFGADWLTLSQTSPGFYVSATEFL